MMSQRPNQTAAAQGRVINKTLLPAKVPTPTL